MIHLSMQIIEPSYLTSQLESENGDSTGWFLPSKDELYKWYINGGDTGFYNGSYWSSSEIDGTNAWFQKFTVDNQDSGTKDAARGVLSAVRAF